MITGFGAEYFATMEDGRRSTVADKSSLESYKSVLTSKNTEDTMVSHVKFVFFLFSSTYGTNCL